MAFWAHDSILDLKADWVDFGGARNTKSAEDELHTADKIYRGDV